MAARLSLNLYTLLAVSMKPGPKSLHASDCLFGLRYPQRSIDSLNWTINAVISGSFRCESLWADTYCESLSTLPAPGPSNNYSFICKIVILSINSPTEMGARICIADRLEHHKVGWLETGQSRQHISCVSGNDGLLSAASTHRLR